ncbi:MAG: hypothetical protein IJE89_04405 [Bacilli bacterium]|nr:hypothetical protein [Bacilli bacterium]
MVKTKLGMEQIIAGALLLNFDSISSVDIKLLSEDFLRKNPDYSLDAENPGYINNYIKTEDGKRSLKDGLHMSSYIPENKSNLQKRLGQIAGARIRKYLETFDMEEFMLRKIEFYSRIRVDDIDNILCKKQQEELKKLDDKRYITSYWEEECIHDDSKVIALSEYGKLRLFKINNSNEIDRFIEVLKTLRYDIDLLDDFLLKQDLDMPVLSILNIENLESFCHTYDRASLVSGASMVCFERLESSKESIFDENGKQVIQDMLSVWDDGHSIYVCHPNHIFDGSKPITKDVRNIKHINWDDIDIEKMFKVNDYKIFVSSDCTEAFKYIHSRFGHEIMQEVKKGNKASAVSYLTIVEKYRFDYEDYYLVRGIIKADYNGYSIAFNPEYKKVIPKSVWDKSLRFSGNEVPQVYCLKRKKQGN